MRSSSVLRSCARGCSWTPGPVLLAYVCALLLVAVPRAHADRDSCVAQHEHAQVERMQGHYLAARNALLACAQRECPRLISNECTTLLGELDSALPTMVFAVVSEQGRDLSDVRVLLDQQPLVSQIDGRPLALDPGVHKLRFEAEGYLAEEQSVSVRAGEKDRLVRVVLRAENAVPLSSAVPPPRADTPEPRGVDARSRRLWNATYALGLASAVSFAITLGASARGYRMEQHCKDDDCSRDYASHGKALYRTVNISAIAGGVLAAAAGATLWSALRRDQHEQSAYGLSAMADRQSAQLTGWGRW